MASFSPRLEETIHQALTLARGYRHEWATLEHLIYALIDDKDAVEVMIACDLDVAGLRADVKRYLDEDLEDLKAKESVEMEEVRPTAGFHRVIQRAVIHVQSSGREEVNGANALVALFAERESHAVYFLQERGMTRNDAVNYISHGIRKNEGASTSLQDGGLDKLTFFKSIPEQKAASIQTGWFMNKVGSELSRTNSKHNDLQALATLRSLKIEMQEMLSSIASETNVDPRISKYLSETMELIPDEIPDNALLQRLSIRERTLSGCIPMARKEWSEFTCQNYEVICNEFALTLDQFSERREFNRNLLEIELEDISQDEVSRDIEALVEFLEGKLARRRIDGAVPKEIREIGSLDTIASVGFEKDTVDHGTELQLNADKLESANNAIKTLAERVLSDNVSADIMSALEVEYVAGVGEGLKKGAREAGEEDGRLIAKTATRAKAAKEISEISSRKLADKYPKIFGWMKRFTKRDDAD